MPDEVMYVLTVAIPLIVVAIVLLYYFKFQYPKDREIERNRRLAVLEDYEKEPEYQFFNAKVIGARKYVYSKFAWSMPMLPTQVDEYYATFLLETGEEVEYKIPEELFSTLQEEEEGILVTVNGNFFDFGNGEEIAETAGTLEE